MATGDRLALLGSLLRRFEKLQEGASTSGEAHLLHKELLCLAQKHWPEEEGNEEEEDESECQLFNSLEAQLQKLPVDKQEKIVSAFKPLRSEVSRRLAEWTSDLNDWISDVGQSKRPAQSQHLAELLREVEDAPQLRWYRQCPTLLVKEKFLIAIATVARALLGGRSYLKSFAASQPKVVSLVQQLVKRLFVIPDLGNILEMWHEGRMSCYNASLARAGQRAVEKLKDDLQVCLVSALRRAATSSQTQAPGKALPPLQLELKEWPMAGCPLARALLEFLEQRRFDIGKIGRPSLRECPPHTMQPATLRKVLERLDAFEILHSGSGTSIVRLRIDAVAALTFKAVGTKPKATSVAGPSAPAKAAPAAKSASNKARDSSVNPSVQLQERKLDMSDGHALRRIIRYGLREKDDEWTKAWQQFCWQRKCSPSLLRGQGPSTEVAAAFIEQNFAKLRKREWAMPFIYKLAGDLADSDSEPRSRRTRHGTSRPEVRGAVGTSQLRRKRKSSSRSVSSCSNLSDQSPRRKKRRRHSSAPLLGYGDLFSKSKLGMTPEVMMMRAQMMGVSMVMNSPLAMMGMRNPLLPTMLPPSTAAEKSRTSRSSRPFDGTATRTSASTRAQQKATESLGSPYPPGQLQRQQQLAIAAPPKDIDRADRNRKTEPTINLDDL